MIKENHLNKIKNNSMPELLAPVGGLRQLYAAIENGADAVYMGGGSYNARINAENFSNAELAEAISYAHGFGVRVYITLNTLVREEEIPSVLEYVSELDTIGADALIMQDYGVASEVSRLFPKLPLHLSTQGSVFNLEGAHAAEALGFTRVVLARELDISEIRRIAENSTVDIEVFAHGALCMCYSGQCQLSNEIGGRSANRGVCGQACRLPYKLLGKDGYFLSPKDLCTLEKLFDLTEAGVNSLKIEGRMKSAEYVAIVTRIYRKYIDLMFSQGGKYHVAPEDKDELLRIFNRGGFTSGYAFPKEAGNLLSGNTPGHMGIRIGTAYKLNGQHGKNYVRVEMEREKNHAMAIGDIIEIGEKNRSRISVTYIKEEKNQGERKSYIVGDVHDKKINLPADVFLTLDSKLVKAASLSFDEASWEQNKERRKININMNFTARAGEPFSLIASDNDGNVCVCTSEDAAETAKKRAISVEDVRKQLEKLGGTVFELIDCVIEVEDGLFIPAAKINELRRSALEKLYGQRRARVLREEAGVSSYDADRVASSQEFWRISDKGNDNLTAGVSRTLYVTDAAIVKNRFGSERAAKEAELYDRIYLPVFAFLEPGEIPKEVLKKCVPVIPGITKGWADDKIRTNFQRICELGRERGLAVGNIGWLREFSGNGIRIFADYGLNLINSLDFKLMAELGVSEVMLGHDVMPADISDMEFHGLIPEIAAGGRIPAMVTECCVLREAGRCHGDTCAYDDFSSEAFLIDRKEERLELSKQIGSCRTIIYSHKERTSKDLLSVANTCGLRHLRLRYYI